MRECAGGLEVAVSVSPTLAQRASKLFVELTVDGNTEFHLFEASDLNSNGAGSFIIHFDISAQQTVLGVAELREANGTVIASATGSATIRPVTTGCFLMELNLNEVNSGADASVGAPDGGVRDASPVDASTIDADPAAPDAAPTPDAPPGAPDAEPPPIDAGEDDAEAGGPPDAMPDAMPDAASDSGVFSPDGSTDGLFTPGDGGAPSLDDEDGDTIPDSTDNCPHVPNFGQAESPSDPDSLGDACDPNPTDPNIFDVIEHFDGFNGSLSGYSVTACTWTVSGGKVSHTTTTGPPCLLLVDLSTPHDAVFVEAMGTTTGLGTMMPKRVGLLSGASTPPPSGYACTAENSGAQGQIHLSRESDMTLLDSVTVNGLTAGSPFTVQFMNEMDATNLDCKIKGSAATAVDAGTGGGLNGFFTHNASAQYDYMVIISSFDMSVGGT